MANDIATRAALTVTYTLSPPGDTLFPPSLSPSASHLFVVEGDITGKTNGTVAYYQSVRKALAAAKEKLGEELTAWRDVVKDGEATKEKEVGSRNREEEGEEEEETEQSREEVV